LVGSAATQDLTFLAALKSPNKRHGPAASQTEENNNSALRISKVVSSDADVEGLAIYFEHQEDPKKSSWAEKNMFEVVRTGQTLVPGLDIDKQVFKLFNNRVLQTNTRGYPRRVFVVLLKASALTRDNLLAIANALKTAVNAIPEMGDHKVVVDEQNFIADENAVWADTLGDQQAVVWCRMITNVATYGNGWAQQFPEKAYAFFRPGDFPATAAAQLGAAPRDVRQN